MAVYDALSRYAVNPGGQTADRVVPPPPTVTYSVYAVVQGDTLENIAARQLGDPRRYWEIADINPQIKFPTDLRPGMAIRLPA